MMQRLSLFFFSIILFSFAMLSTGCAPINMAMSPTPTPTPVADDTGDAFVFTANQASNNISAFRNDSTGNLTPISGSPFSVPGEPFGLAASPNNKFLYATAAQNATVAGFSINSTTGVLTSLSCSAAVTDSGPARIAIAQSGKFLFTENTSGSISAFSLDSTSGCLTFIASTPTDALPREITVDRTGQFLYVGTSTGINAFSIAADGTLTRITGFTSSSSTMAAVKASPTTDVLVTTDSALSNFQTFRINTTTGALTPISINSGGSGPASVSFNPAFDPTAPMIYVANNGSDNLTSTNIDSTGDVNFFTHLVSDASGPIDSGVDPAGKFVYIANARSNNVAFFLANINGSNFTSVLIGTIPAGTQPRSIAVVGHP